MIDEQTNVVKLDLMPNIHGLVTRHEFALQPCGSLTHAKIIKLDSFTLGPLLAMPVCRFITVFGSCRFSSEKLVMAVKTIHHRLGNVVGNRGVKALRKHL